MDSFRSALRIYLIGLCMGSADAVPGVSGGTIALIAGVYERLIDAITSLTPENGRRLLGSLLPPDKESFRKVLGDIDALFLLPLLIGMVTAVILVTRIVHIADQEHPAALFGFFFGLIAVSVIILLPQVSLVERRYRVAAIGGFLIAFLLSGNLTILEGHTPVLTLLAGAVAVTAMILPGISGSLMLVILGQYTFLSTTLSTFVDRLGALASGGGIGRLVDPGRTVLVFVIGAIIGLLTVSRIVDRALERDRETTFAFLVALVVGALRAPIAEIGGRGGLSWTTTTITEFGFAALVGAAFLYALDRYAIDVKLDG